MCGIFGVASLQPITEFGKLAIPLERLCHRGPDDSGIWWSFDKRVGFGHRRLSIIDLSPGGHQPMVSPDGRCCITYNGEVYNFQQIRKDLEKTEFRCFGGSDTEVILNAYRAWGTECIARFNGMFSFAIYDRGDDNAPSSLFLARDRAGKKPLYYSLLGESFQFASELKSLVLSNGIDSTALNYYLALGYVPGSLCLALGVNKLPPAHAARLDLNDLSLTVWRYWQLPSNRSIPCTDGEEFADQVQHLLEDAVRLRMISDVPLGTLLSGGLDSSLIVAAAVKATNKRIKTFTIGLPGSTLDESGYARCVADYFDTEHHVLEADNPSLAIVDEYAPFVDEPLADSSILPSFMVSRLTRQYVTVALGGDGGDELFGGYLDYPQALADQALLGWIPRRVLSSIAQFAANLPAGMRGRNRLSALVGGPLQQMIWGSPYFDIRLRQRLITDCLLEEVDAPERFLLGLYEQGKDPVDSMTRAHFGSILPDDFLVKLDRASMANSLETRAPFLDVRLVELAFSRIPSCWKVSSGVTRRIQRILAQRLLPPDLDINRKQGFSIPLDMWLRQDKCYKIREYMPYLPQFMDRGFIEELIQGEMQGRANGARLFALLMLGISMKNNGWST